jgi:flavin-dependent dehydrogenase
LLVIGGGPGGLVCAGGAALLGARVALVEKHLLAADRLSIRPHSVSRWYNRRKA